MKRLIGLLVLVLLGFYVAWPAWTGYQIANALKAKDTATLERKILFDDVRVSLRPAALQKVGEFYDKSPLGGAVMGNIKNDVAPTIADSALKALVTAPNLIRIVHDGKNLKDSAESILSEQIAKIGGLPGLGGGSGGGGGGGLGGLGGIKLPGGIQLPGGLGGMAEKMGIPGLGGGAPKQEAPVATTTTNAPPPSYGLGNLKRFGFLGPLAFEVGVAKDASAAGPDVVVEMRFVNGDWRVVGVKPRI